MSDNCENFNSLYNNNFAFTIDRIPNIVFRLVAINIPQITINSADTSTPTGYQYFPGSEVNYGDLSIEFIVDENLSNYEEIYRWITQQRFAENQIPKNNQESFLTSDAILTTLTNSSNINRIFKFKDIFPIDLGQMNFTTRDQTPDVITCTSNFKFSYFELLPTN